jgi:hypothetical protein
MAYPYLPVNPCCTEVVLNSPCGCNSTIINGGCNNPCGTNLTASSTIVYDGPALTCTTAEPCDTLNVILQKIDEIICNLLTQINTLNIQITNITRQITIIEGDIFNIYNQLGECCTTTTSTSSSSTTTSTTTIHPCENFSLSNTGVTSVAIIITNCNTGEPEAIILNPGDTNICVVTDSPLTVPGTIIVTPNGPCLPPPSSTTTTTSSSTSTSTSSTTTTTTTAIPCECLTFYNGSDSGQEIIYIDCAGDTQFGLILPDATNQYCGCCGEASSPEVLITIGADCIAGLCPTTTTTSTTILPNCSFTGIANELPDPTTTTTSSSSTTTTTTTSYPFACSCVTVIVDQTDLDDATGNTPAPGKANNTVYIITPKSSGCDGSDVDFAYTTAGVSGFCIKTSSIGSIQMFYYKNDNPIYFPTIDSTYNILYSSCSVNGDCTPL